MLTPIAFALAAIAVWGWVSADRHSPFRGGDRGSKVLGALMFLLTIVPALVVGAGVATALGASLDSRMNSAPTEQNELVNLRTVDGISGSLRGSMFVMVGQIGSERYFYWYERAGTAVTPRQVRAGVGVYVFEEDRENAVLRVYDHDFAVPLARWFALRDFGRTWHFHVPKGTVQKEGEFSVE